MAVVRFLTTVVIRDSCPKGFCRSRILEQQLRSQLVKVSQSSLVTMAETSNGSNGKPVSLVAAIQMTSGNDKVKNMQVCNSLIEQAVQKKAQMIFLPEAFDFIGNGREETIQLAETLDGPVISNYKDIARKLNVWLSLGGFHLKLDGCKNSPQIANAHLIIDSNGNIVAKYCKMHLFDVSLPEKNVNLRESSTIQSGEEVVAPVPTPVGKIGLTICYDLRFPELSDRLRREGADILTYPSAFTVPTGEAHWEVLLRSRAVENQCYVVAAAQVGSHNSKRSSYGHSMIIDPWGRIVTEAASSDQLIFGEINLLSLQQIRREMPVINHKRFEVAEMRRQYCVPDDSVGEEVFPFGQVSVKQKMVFLESRFSRAFVNKKCILPGHVLLITKRSVGRLHLLREEEITDLFLLVQKVGIIMEHIQGTVAANVACQDGPAAGQSIHHVHIHVLPRRPGDFKRGDQVHEELEQYDHESEPPKWRTEEEMVAECNHIRKVIRENFASFLS